MVRLGRQYTSARLSASNHDCRHPIHHVILDVRANYLCCDASRDGFRKGGGTMPYVTCPTCGERGKIPPNLVGARIKCRKCGLGFTVSPPAAKGAPGASASAVSPGSGSGPTAVAEPLQGGIEVEGLDASSWALPTETISLL